MKKILFSLAGLLCITTMLWSCSDSDVDGDSTPTVAEGGAFLQLQINTNGSSSTRADDSDTDDTTSEGSTSDSNINSIKVVLTDEGGYASYVFDYSSSDLTTSNGVTSTAIKTVEAGDYYVYVLANYEDNSSNYTVDGYETSTIEASSAFPLKDMALNISNAYTSASCPLASTTAGFLMTNEEAPSKTTLYDRTSSNATGTGTYNGTSVSGVNVVSVNLDRAAAKITTAQSSNADLTFTDANGNTQGVTINSVALANMNSTFYLIKQELDYSSDGEATSGTYDTSLYYAKDPNYDKPEGSILTEDQTYFYSAAPADDEFKSLGTEMYTLENTMDVDHQLRGTTTALVFKTSLNSYHWTTLSSTGDTLNNYEKRYSDKFSSLVEYNTNLTDGKNNDITSTMFDPTSTENTGVTFYAYNNLIFVSQAAAKMYKLLQNNTNITDNSTLLSTYGSINTDDIYEYQDGVVYYVVFIQHNNNESAESWGKYGVVRNHSYTVTVEGVSGLGNNVPDVYTPSDDSDSGDGDDDSGDDGDSDGDSDGDGDDDSEGDDTDGDGGDDEETTPEQTGGYGDTPIDTPETYMQVSITINKWISISQSATMSN